MLAAATVTTAAIAVPTIVVGAEELTVETKPGMISSTKEKVNVNSTIKFDVNKLADADTSVFIEKYEWYISEEIPVTESEPKTEPETEPNKPVTLNKLELLTGNSTDSLKVPLKAAGKKIQLTVTVKVGTGTEAVTKQFTDTVDIDNFNLVIKSGVELIGTNKEDKEDSINTATAGDTVTVGEIKLLDNPEGEVIEYLEPSQVTYDFQWFQKGGNIFSKIEGATNRSYTIPLNALDQSLTSFVVEITAYVNGQKDSTISQHISLEGNKNFTDNLINDITALIERDSGEPAYLYAYTGSLSEFEAIEDSIENLLIRYNKLTAGSKKLITNYSILTEAQANIKLVKQLKTDMETVNAEIFDILEENLTTAEKRNLITQFSAIYTRYEALDSLQRSLLDDEMLGFITFYSTTIKETNNFGPEEALSETGAVKLINESIAGLYGLESDLRTTYNLVGMDSSGDYVNGAPYLSEKVVEINAAIKALNSTFTPLVYTNLVKEMQNDIKKVESFVKKVDKIKSAADEKKKLSAINAAKKDYVKLTALQRSLVPNVEDYMDKFIIKPDTGDEPTLVTEIAELYTDEDNYKSTSVTDFNSDVNKLLAEYKSYDSTKKKTVNNYSLLKAAEKDGKAALKVENQMKALSDLPVDGETPSKQLQNLKKAISKYKSAVAAYTKLTRLQQSLLETTFTTLLTDYSSIVSDYNKLNEEIQNEKNSNKDPVVSDKEPQYEQSNVDAVVADIAALITGDKQIEYVDFDITEITTIKNDYKALKSAEKKGVYNYSILTKAESDLKKAQSVIVNIEKANVSNDYSKLVSAKAAFSKLTSLQQSIVKNSDGYSLMEANIIVFEEETILDGGLNSRILEQLSDFNDTTIDIINELNEKYTKLNSKLKKQITNSKLLTEAVKDAKKVTSFATSMQKVSGTTDIKKQQTIVNNYYKLSAAQMKLFTNSYIDLSKTLVSYEKQIYNQNQGAIELNNTMGELINVDGESYNDNVESFASYITDLMAQYKGLSSADKKLVTNYSILTKAQSNIKTVQGVLDQSEILPDENSEDSPEYKKFERAYNKLNPLQLSLYMILSNEQQ